MWIQQIVLGILGLSAGIIVAGGLFSFIIELGILADFADRTSRCQEEDSCGQFLDCLPGSLQDAGLWLWRRC